MLTSFSLTQLILISAAYLTTLFGVAWITERGYVPRRLVRHPLVYTLSLGVYASAWAFYGTVGLAYQYGYGFLAIYLGVSGAFLLAPVLLVVFVTMVINVLKVFDLVFIISQSAGANQKYAQVLATQLYQSYGNQQYGLASAVGVILVLLVLPAMAFNIRRFRKDQG